jgi:hypothetical protein
MPALSRTLWLIVAPPLAGFVWQVARQLRRKDRRRSDRWATRVGVGSVVLAGGATLGHALRLVREPAGTEALTASASIGVDAGPLGVGLGLRFDALSGAASALACAAALAVAALQVSRKADAPEGRAWAWLDLSLAGGLLSFLAGDFLTLLAGWTLAAAAAAWLEGWSDPGRGAVRSTRGALAVLALLVGAVSHDDAGGPGAAVSTAAFLVAIAAMSATPPPAGAPSSLVALACGGTTALVGPVLLLRLPALAPLGPGAGQALTVAGAAMLAVVVRRAVLTPAGPSRGLVLVGGAPAGLTCVAFGADGAKGGLFVLLSSGGIAALLLLAAAERGVPPAGARAPRDLEAALLGQAPEDAGVLLLSFQRWVVEAIGGAIVVLTHASAWALSRIDERRR